MAYWVNMGTCMRGIVIGVLLFCVGMSGYLVWIAGGVVYARVGQFWGDSASEKAVVKAVDVKPKRHFVKPRKKEKKERVDGE